jgi:hypothetical protein
MAELKEEAISFLPKMDLQYLASKDYRFSQENDGNVKALIIHDYPLPVGKYQVDVADILIQIPNGYNDTHPDMFFCIPHLKLQSTKSEPTATGGRLKFNEAEWQQWSRHSNVGNDWRPGIDGIKSHLRKVDRALAIG